MRRQTVLEGAGREVAELLWIVNLGCIDLNPHPVRADDLEHPDELRVDLDPGPGVSWDEVRRVTARAVRRTASGGQELHSRCGRMDAEQQRLEVEPAGADDDDLTVDDADSMAASGGAKGRRTAPTACASLLDPRSVAWAPARPAGHRPAG